MAQSPVSLQAALDGRHYLECELGAGLAPLVVLRRQQECAGRKRKPRRASTRVRHWIEALLIVFGVPVLAHAQAVNGSLEGRIVSTQGEPLENAVVTASGPFLQGTRTVTTDVRGYFHLQAVPPGDYELRLAHIGYRPVVMQRVVVELGRTTGIETVAMTPQPLDLEPIVVTAPALSLDPAHTTAGGTLDPADYAGLPGDRDYKSLIVVLPHANASTRGDPVNVAGSTGLENQYYIDGVNVTDTKDASRATSLPYNFVRAVEVKIGGYEAQYGRALGAVVNAVTYSGTNDFEANIFGFVQPSALALDPRVAPAITESGAVVYDVGARVGGPILRDRLWYSAALNPRVDQVDKEITGLGFFPDRTTSVRFAAKLNWRASTVTDLELSFFGDPTTRDGVDPLPAGVTSVDGSDALLNRQTSGGVIGSLRAAVTPSPSALLEASVARQWDRYSVAGATDVGRSTEMFIDYVTQSVGGGYPWHQYDDRGRLSLMVRGTYSFGDSSDQHTVIAGAEYEDALVASEFGATGIGIFIRPDSAFYMAQYQGYSGRFHNRSPAAYIQDSWRLTDRLTLNIGVRWSGQFFTGASGSVVQRIPDEWQPRTGFSWQVGHLGTQRVFGSYGRVYQTLPDNLAVLLFVDYTGLNYFYSSDPRQAGTAPDSVQNWSTTEAQTAQSVPGLHGDNFDEYTVGYERLLGASTRLTMRGMYRHLRSAYLVGVDNGQLVLGTPGQGNFDFLPAPRRDYTALEIAAEGAWRRVRYRASYVLSRTWGNYPGLYSSDLGFASPGLSILAYREQAPNSSGLLPNDRTHVVKASAAYAFGLGVEAGAFVYVVSGSPINEFAASIYGPNSPTFVVPRGSVGRTPALWNLDLRLAYVLPVARGPRSRVMLDVLHVGNPRRTTRVDEMHYPTLDQNGNPASPNPQYRQPVTYQAPMGARLGVEISF
jgi:carboxypeptidase family protein